MFSRLRTSLTNPPEAIRYTKDSWIRVMGHLLGIPLFLLLPAVLAMIVTPGMSQARYSALVTAIQEDFKTEGAVIEEGTLSGNAVMTASFDHFILALGSAPETMSAVVVLFHEDGIRVSVGDALLDDVSYDTLGLSSHDFADTSDEAVGILSVALRDVLEDIPAIIVLDLMIVYMAGLIDYALIVMFMTLALLLFASSLPMSFGARFRLSAYVSSVHVIVGLILALFGLEELAPLSVIPTYAFNVWAYRGIRRTWKGDAL